MKVRLTQIDGKLPNLTLMRLATYHRKRGDEVVLTKRLERDLFEPSYGRVYGSAIFKFSAPARVFFRTSSPRRWLAGRERM